MTHRFSTPAVLVLALVLGLAAPAARAANGGAAPGITPAAPPQLLVAGARAALRGDLGVAPRGAPPAVRRVIAAANAIRSRPYRYGGGHRSFTDTAYDCSGAVSFALHGGGLLDAPEPSGALMSWGAPGRGRWITVYANGGHAFLVVAGLRFDTSGSGGSGPRWRSEARPADGFMARHPPAL